MCQNTAVSSIKVSNEPTVSEPLIVPMQIQMPNHLVSTHGMLDDGAAGTAFIDSIFAHNQSFPLKQLGKPVPTDLADGSTGPEITHYTRLNCTIGPHTETLSFFVMPLSYDFILGRGWLDTHNPAIDWPTDRLTFSSDYCRQNCLPSSLNKHVESGLRAVPESSPSTPSPPVHSAPKKPMDICVIGKYPFDKLARDSRNEIFAISIRDIDHVLGYTPQPEPKRPLGISSVFMTAKSFTPRTHREATAVGYRKMNTALYASAIRPQDIEKALAVKPDTDPATILPEEYHTFLDVFSRQAADQLPERRLYDHKIELNEGKEPPKGPLYSMSHDELLVLRKTLTDYLDKGFIRVSSSPASSPVLFAKRPGGGLRFCVDYRGLNLVTKRNRYPLPLIKETLDRLCKAKFYTKLDIIAAFNKLRIAEGDEWKTAMRTRYGLFEWLVLPFGLANGPSSFQCYINDVLREYLDIFCTAYIDDILIYSNSLKEHKKHVKMVLEALRKAGLQVDINKCEFHTTRVKYLGIIITTEGLEMDPAKVDAIQSWNSLKNAKEVLSFLGFANFYRRFIKGFSDIAKPLTSLTKKDKPFEWTAACEHAFLRLKEAFSSYPILAHYDPNKACVVETDSSDVANGGVLSQVGSDGLLHPVAYFSSKLTPQQINYEIYDKELLAIVKCLETWRAELEGAPSAIQILCDHKNLEYFMSTKTLNRRQVRWAEFLSRFNFKITYRPGKQGAKPDALTRRSIDVPQEGDPRLECQKQTIIRPEHLGVAPIEVQIPVTQERLDDQLFITPDLGEEEQADPPEDPSDSEATTEDEDDEETSLEDLIAQAYQEDPFPGEVLEQLRTGARHSKKINLTECEDRNGRLFYRDKFYVPDYTPLKVRLCKLFHDSAPAGHPGKAKTFELLDRSYHWPGGWRFVARYVRNCHPCARAKPRHNAKYGLLKPLPVPQRPWKQVSVDFVTGLPLSKGKYDMIMQAVCRLSKERHWIPCHTSMDTPELSQLFMDTVYRLHGLCDGLTTDRDTLFTNALWKQLTKRLGVNRQMSTAFHPETDGQTERLNAVMEQYLRNFVTYTQEDWADWLSLGEFSANNWDSETTGVSPFFANKGFHPRMGIEPPDLTEEPAQAEVGVANEIADHMEQVHDHLRSQMRFAQARQEHYANQSREPEPRYQVGDKVYLDLRNIKTKRPSKKLDFKNGGPFTITKIIGNARGNAYQLDLPPTMNVHPVFHTSLLKADPDDPYDGQINPSPPAIESR